ncbi:MAG TPA: VWA domain-containing protein [Bryobacteraceae bacterium]|jgi:VWFA-related protein
MKIAAYLLAGVALLLAPVHAQQDGGVILRTETRVVQVDVTVRNSQGKPVDDLKQSDFTILDNGKARPFTIFSVNGAAPKTAPEQPQALPERSALPPNTFTNIGAPPPPARGHSTIILLDGVNGWFESFVWGSQGIQGLMRKLPPDERIALYVLTKFDGLLQVVDLTTDRERVRKAAASFRPRAMEAAPVGMGPSGDGNGMVENAAIAGAERDYFMRGGAESIRESFNALSERLRALPGRKSVFWITEGFPPALMRDSPAWNKTFTGLNDANIAVNTVDADGIGGPRRLWGAGAILGMQEVAERTGGEAFYHRNDLDAALAGGISDSRSSYTLGFYLTELDGKYHELKVVVKRPGLDLNYRRGYLAETDAMRDLAGRKSELDSALLNPLDLTGLGMVAKVEEKSGNLTLHLRLDPKALTVAQAAGLWKGQVEELFIERNSAGDRVARVSQTSNFSVGAKGKAAYDRSGPTLTHTFRLAPGAVKLVIIVRDSASGRTGSLTAPLTP